MDDKTMLELAARAAGFNHFFYSPTFGDVTVANDMASPPFGWNPLTDDGDALRLAVKLRLSVSAESEEAFAGPHEKYNATAVEEYGNDPYAATRRAIVRAAAEIGKGMGVGS